VVVEAGIALWRGWSRTVDPAVEVVAGFGDADRIAFTRVQTYVSISTTVRRLAMTGTESV
ncbi:MAG: hypothetical protein AB1649_28150, partial [Chloroflexota bacterium]